MDINVKSIGKKFNKEWVFRNLDLSIKSGEIIAITGNNGSGKSTLLRILSGFSDPSEGEVIYSENDKKLEIEEVSSSFSMTGPYVNIIDELTLEEHLKFHYEFKKQLIPINEIAERAGLINVRNKAISEFSSGMKQRVKLSLSLFTKSSVIFLDEPTSNLDEFGIEWYQKEIQNLIGKTTIIIASNQAYEFDFIPKRINLSNFNYSGKPNHI